VTQVTLPLIDQPYSLMWKHNTTENLTLKEVYDFKRHHFPKLHCTKLIWSKDILPSKSMLTWRLMLDKLPTGENLIMHERVLFSINVLFMSPTSWNCLHLFFQFPYSCNIWNWFATILNCTIQFQTKEDIWSLCEKGWNPQCQCKLVITSSIINIINAIWFARNQIRFNNKKIHWKSSISTIITNPSLSGNLRICLLLY